jgi:glycosyltransferase involved in cell wall biosynthesis
MIDLSALLPINSLSFGNVSVNLLFEMYKRKMKVALFVRDFDISAYEWIDNDFRLWMESSIQDANINFRRDVPSLNLWHINGAQNGIGDRRSLFTFHELTDVTRDEISLCESFDNVFFSSPESVRLFKGRSNKPGVY